jgi:hypothetical protein
LVTVNGGAPQRGGIAANFGDTLQLYADSTIGWSIPAAVWEITTYPAGWPPPSGWSVDTTTKAYFILGNLSSLPPFQLPDASTGLWGKWKFRLRVNGGGGPLTDWSTAVEIVSPHGVHDLASSEGSEFGAERGWPRDQQQNLRLLDKAVAGAGSTLASIGVTPPLVSTGPPNAPVLGIVSATPAADGAMSHQDKAKLDGATPNPAPATLVARDTLGGSTFHVLGVEAGIVVAATGTLNVSQAPATSGPGAQGSIRAQQGAAGQSGAALLLGGGDAGTPGGPNAWAGNTLLQLGQLDAATQSSAALQLLAGPTGAFLTVACKGGTAALTVATGLTLAAGAARLALTPAGLALTVPVVQVANTPAPPPANPPAGLLLYAEAGAWKARSAAGVIATLAPAGTAGPTLQLLDVVMASFQTGDNTSKVLLVYPVPANALLELDISVQVHNTANGFGSWFRRIVRVKRDGGAPILKPVVTPMPDDDETGGLSVAAALSGGNVEVIVTGIASVTLVWFVTSRIQGFVP